ncbi:ferroportin-like isoform X2 [Eulemur rufifrons]|uniref:ferroportin-like isoform X2 n=1 Tax=Eulemur rufifrons TaxID=859984 RepID=UPI0037425E5A
MVGELNDTENSGNEEKQTKTSGIRRMMEGKSLLGATLIYLMSPRFLIYVSCALSMWGDRMWHFAMSVFLIELYGHNLLLSAVFGLVVAGSVLIFGVLIGDWIDRKPRNKVAHASLFTQNASVTACCIVLMLVFSYKREMEQIWHGWLTVACYAVVTTLAALANLAGTALTITVQRDWIVSLTGGNRAQLAVMNATVRRLDQIINIFAPLSVGQVMTWASHVIGCGFILGWNLVSLLVEFLFLSRVYQLVPQLAVKPQQHTGGNFLERQQEAVNIQGQMDSWETTDRFTYRPRTSEKPKDHKSRREGQQATTTGFRLGLRKLQRLLRTCREGKNSSSNHGLLKEDQVHVYPFERNLNQPIVPDRSSIHWTNSTVLFQGQQRPEPPESYISIILLFSGVILARIGLWSFDLTVTQLLQENIPEVERGAVNGVQCSLNYLMDLIHFVLVMLAPWPQQFGMLVLISIPFVTTGHMLYFFYARKCKIKNAHAKKTVKKSTWTPLT